MAAASVPAAVFVGVVGGLIMVIFLMLFFMMCVIGIVKQQRNKDGEGECTNSNRKQHDDLGEGLLCYQYITVAVLGMVHVSQ